MKNNSILLNKIFPTSSSLTLIRNIIFILFGTILLTVSAKVQVPFWPVPITMQTFIVFLIGMVYGWQLSFYTFLTYLAQGALGLPVFASGGGLAYFIGPTAGYLYGMLFATIIIGKLSELGFSNSYFKTFVTLLLGSVVIFSFGMLHLGTFIGYNKVFSAGLFPFVHSELFKIALAVSIIPSLSKKFK
jgi:biotin transport system substrate-specific component|tara:strand:+ start:92 stop:655 length:564 start_codon:yes stop_codon:yes gene_type:complete